MQYPSQPKRAESILQTTETVERWECDVREYEQRFGKMLDEDVKIGVILAPQVENRCHLNSHILKSYAQVRTMLFDYCRAQTDTPPTMLYPWISRRLAKEAKARKARKAKATRKVKVKAKARKAKTTKMRRTKTKARTIPKLLNTLVDTVFTAKVGDM